MITRQEQTVYVIFVSKEAKKILLKEGKKMKKVLCLIVSLLLIVPMLSFADVSGEVSYCGNAQSVYIAGDLSKAPVTDGKYVTLLITDKSGGDIRYIAQYPVDANGNYEAKFMFEGNLDECNITLKEGNNIVNTSVTAAYVENKPTLYSLTLRDENGSHVIEPEEFVKATATITNKYNAGGKYKIIVAFYDENGKVTGAQEIADGKYELKEIHKEISAVSKITVPENASEIKAFLWEDTKRIIPLSEEQMRNVSDKKFGGDTEEIRVAFIGDSITHNGCYIYEIEHYYHTRYPEKNIVFVNKGMSGNQTADFLERFDWDISEDEIAGDIDEATMMLGINDYYAPGYVDATDEKKQAVVDKFAGNVKKVINLCRDNGISLTIITPSLYDATEELVTNTENYPDKNYFALAAMTEELKKIAKEYDIPLIDFWTPTTDITEDLRQRGYTGPVITGTDRVHPGEQGGTYMAYQFVKQQDGNPIVASVELNASNGSVNTQNASVNVISACNSSVSYEYLPKAIPIAYTSYYELIENDWGVPITEDINREIIKVTGLEEGTYKIKIEDKTLTGEYTSDELANGVNIAIDANNPAQIQAKSAYDLAKTKARNESSYRGIAITEQQFRKRGFDESDFNYDMTEKEFEALGNWPSTHKNYYSTDPENFNSKMYENENWEKLRQQEKTAKEAAKPIKRTVVIEKQ